MRIRADEGIGGGLGDQLRDPPLLPRRAPFEQGHDLARHQLERLGFARREPLARGRIDDAQRADLMAIGKHQWRPGVEPDMRRVGDQRIAGEARVGGGIGHHHHTLARDRVPAKAVAAAGLGRS